MSIIVVSSFRSRQFYCISILDVKFVFKIVYRLKSNDKFKIFDLLNIDNSKHTFIDEKFERKICEKLKIAFQQLIKFKLMRKYNDKLEILIIHVIYFIIIVNKHRKNLISLID